MMSLRNVLRLFFPALLMLPLMAVQGSAQTVLVADVPFDFTICHEQMFAGKYRLERVSSASANMLLVRSQDNRSVEIVCTHDLQGTKRQANGKLVFNRYGDQHFLSEIWLPGQATGNELIKSEKEDALLKELTPRKKREKVTIKITETKPN